MQKVNRLASPAHTSHPIIWYGQEGRGRSQGLGPGLRCTRPPYAPPPPPPPRRLLASFTVPKGSYVVPFGGSIPEFPIDVVPFGGSILEFPIANPKRNYIGAIG